MAERNSYRDTTLIRGYSIHIQRYEFASGFCQGKRVLDAGCGIGYGSTFLAARGASEVVGVDLSGDAVAEARQLCKDPRVQFVVGDLQELSQVLEAPDGFDCIINLENIEHLPQPELFLEQAVTLLAPDGVFICSTPNGEVSLRDEHGNLRNRFHLREYTPGEFTEVLSGYFAEIETFGQWQTHAGKARVMAARAVFEQLCESYFNPITRLGRAMKRLWGRPVAGPPVFTAEGESYPHDDVIAQLDSTIIPWQPRYLLAVCRGPNKAERPQR